MELQVIYAYSRADALQDGVLVDVTEWASAKTGFMGGFAVPVAVTAAVWHDIEQFSPKSHQDIRGRAHDVLALASLAARRASGKSTVFFRVHMRVGRSQMQTYKLVCGPGDNAEPVITIMRPDED